MNLKEIRAKNRLTQSDLASLVGVSQAAVANYENGTRRPEPKVAEKISDVLDISLEDMWDMFYSSKESEATDDDASASHA